MKTILNNIYWLLILLIIGPATGHCKIMDNSNEVVIVGATPAGIAAAINSAREGSKVLLIERTNHIGGLVTGGLSDSDFRTYESLGGTWKEFMDRVVDYYKKNYGPNSMQVKASMRGVKFEPKVALKVFTDMLEEYDENIQILLQHEVEYAETRVKPNGHYKLTGVRVKNLKTGEIKVVNADVFIDATYEGDLMALAGSEYRVGSEAQSEYNESLASDEANWHVQCYNFRPVLTRDPDIRLPIPKPEGYENELKPLYLPLIDKIENDNIKDVSNIIQDDRILPNNKADFNDEKGYGISLHVCNPTDIWPEGNVKSRELIFDYIKRYNQGFIYFLQHEQNLPEWVRESMGQWGLPKDEFEETNHWPPVVYVREGRRMVGEYIFTQHDTQPVDGSVRAPAHEDAIAIGDVAPNSHGTHEPVHGVLKGEIIGGSITTRPWQVPYGVIVPKNIDGLLVPVAVSASRVGFGSIRMEPTWTALGQAAGLAASQAFRKNIEVRNISVSELQKRLHELGAKTFYVSDVPPSSKYFKAVQYLGNRGFFQRLYSPEEADNWAQVRIPDPTSFNRWVTAVPYHDVQPGKNLTEELARSWLNRAGIDDGKLLNSFQEYTRGDFINLIYDKTR